MTYREMSRILRNEGCRYTIFQNVQRIYDVAHTVIYTSSDTRKRQDKESGEWETRIGRMGNKNQNRQDKESGERETRIRIARTKNQNLQDKESGKK